MDEKQDLHCRPELIYTASEPAASPSITLQSSGHPITVPTISRRLVLIPSEGGFPHAPFTPHHASVRHHPTTPSSKRIIAAATQRGHELNTIKQWILLSTLPQFHNLPSPFTEPAKPTHHAKPTRIKLRALPQSV